MNKKNIAFFVSSIMLGIIISVILSKVNVKDKPQIYRCVSIQDYEGGDYSPEHYYLEEELKSFIFNTQYRRMCVQLPETAYKIASSLLSSKYGKQYADSKKPFRISLLSGRVWKVIAKDSMAVVYIQKLDARILKIERYDNAK